MGSASRTGLLDSPNVLAEATNSSLVPAHSRIDGSMTARIVASLFSLGLAGCSGAQQLSMLSSNSASDQTPLRTSATDAELARPFRMEIEDVFSISGRGTVVTGRIEAGRITVGDVVDVVSRGDSLRSRVTGIEMFRSKANSARAGDNVGILLDGVGRDEVSRGDLVVQFGSVETSLMREVTANSPGPIGPRIVKIIREHLDVEAERVTPDARLIEDLGADSLGLIELVMAAEEEFGIEVPDADAERILTVRDAIDYVRVRVGDPSRSAIRPRE